MSLLDAMLEGGEPGCTGQAGGPTGKIYYPTCQHQTHPIPVIHKLRSSVGRPYASTVQTTWHDRKLLIYAASNMHVWGAC